MSSDSSTPNSTSTYEYSHEPYDTFSLKVSSLARTLFNCDRVELKRNRGGSYNRTIVARLITGDHSKGSIFRIPRFRAFNYGGANDDNDSEIENSSLDSRILDQATILQYLTQQKVPSPGLLAFDAMANNEIGSSYVVQEFATGVALSEVYGAMSLSERLSVVDALVNFLMRMETITFTQSGKLCLKEGMNIPSRVSDLTGVVLTDCLPDIRSFAVGLGNKSEECCGSPNPYELLSRLLLGWSKQEQDTGPNPITEMWRGLLEMLEQMKILTFFSNPQPSQQEHTILFHWDLEPRNILVRRKHVSEEQSEGDGWEIDKVIDWDDVRCVPSVLTRRPPVWLWDFSDDDDHSSFPDDYDGDYDLLSPDHYTATANKLSSDDMRVKQHFEQQFVQALPRHHADSNETTFLEAMYGRGRWIRRVARFALHGASDSQDLQRFVRLKEEWSVALPVYTSKASSTST